MTWGAHIFAVGQPGKRGWLEALHFVEVIYSVHVRRCGLRGQRDVCMFLASL